MMSSTKNLKTDLELNELEYVYESNKFKFEYLDNTFQTALQTTRENIDWISNRCEEIVKLVSKIR